jgi:hypothetical protein
MAVVKLNQFAEALSGAIGGLVFKQLNGKTILCGKSMPNKKKETEKQRETRSKFKRASAHAKGAMLNPKIKDYYTGKAKELNLPNAYTAAIKDFMRNGQLTFRDIKL